MSLFRGIPDPHPDFASLQSTVEALKESVESDAQGIRNRSLRTTDVDRARAQRAAISGARTNSINFASLAELRGIVADLSAQLNIANADITALDLRVTANEAAILDHETRIAALEP